MTTTKLGLDGKAYISTTTHETGSITWTEMDLVESIEHEDAKGEADVNNRSSRFTKSSAGQRAISYSLTMTYDASDAVIELLRDAYDAGTVLALAVMDGDITTSGEIGFYVDVEVFSSPKPEELEDFDKITFKLKPSAKSTFEPARVLIA